MPAKRLFVSLDLPEGIAESLVRLDPQLRGVRWQTIARFHLTLAFLGNVAAEPAARLEEELGAIQFAAFFLPLVGIGAFPAKGRPKVIWMGVGRGHPHLFQLHKRVLDAALAAGLEPDLRPWRPHVTLARCEHVATSELRPFLRAHADFDAGLFQVSAFHLKSSQLAPSGSRYTTELTVAAG